MRFIIPAKLTDLHKVAFILLITCQNANIFAQFHAPCDCFEANACANFTVVTKHCIPDHPTFWNPVSIDTNCCNNEFRPIIKVTADGVTGTQIELLNMPCCSSGTFDGNTRVTLHILDDDDNLVNNTQPNRYGSFEFIDFANGKSTFSYKHPKELPEAGMMIRNINVKVLQQDPISGNYYLYGFLTIEVHRPPIVFVHGLWSDASAFDPMVKTMSNIQEYEDFQFYQADYKTTNASSFQYNEWVVRDGIEQLIRQCEDNDLSVGKVNLVVHSMGGLLARQYVQSPIYTVRKDVHHLITCNTPHAGSQMANFLLDPDQYGDIIADMFGALDMDCHGGAVDNLRVNSIPIAGIQAGSAPPGVKYHSLITVDPSVGNHANLIATIMAYFPVTVISPSLLTGCAGSFLDDIFDLDDHDSVVAAESQAGGLSGLQTNTVNNQEHSGSVANNEVIFNVENLLNEPFDSGLFGDIYPVTSVTYDLDFPCLPFAGEEEHLSRSTVSLNITSPTTGSTVTAGDTVAVTFTASMLDSVSFLMRFRSDSLALIANAAGAGNVNFIIPSNLLGWNTLLAVGFGTDKKIKVMDSIQLNVTTSATLDSIVFYPDIMYLHQSDSLTYRVTGLYSDSISRDLTLHPSLVFDFSLEHASKSGQFIRLNDPASDTLRLSFGSVVSAPVGIRLTGINYLPGCELVTNANNSGFGSLRYALDCVTAYDTIRFASALSGDTISLDSQVLNIYKSVYIINSNPDKVAIRTNSAPRVFRIYNDINVWLENLNLISGDTIVSAISNAGNLTLKNVRISNTFGGTSEFANNESGFLTILGTCTMH